MKTISLFEATSRLKDHIELWDENKFWVTAEIKSINFHPSGHIYLELIEKATKSDNTLAEARATIWRNVAGKIVSKLMLKAGIKVLLHASFNYSQRYGLSINVTDIDPTYTLGDLERRKKEIIERLTIGGLIDRNRHLSLNIPAKRIAVISSATAAGYTDFINTLNGNRYNFRFYTKLFNAVMQGDEAEESIIKALTMIPTERFDAVAIIRGGGASTDLLAFDSEALATACARFNLPIITGIGHQRDTSIVDMVAYHNAITPTAVAEYFISNMLELQNRLNEINAELSTAATIYVRQAKMHLDNLGNGMARATEMALRLYFRQTESLRREIESAAVLTFRRCKEQIVALNHRLNESAVMQCQAYRRELISLERQIELIDPKNILRKGYSLTLHKGKPINDPTQLQSGDEIQTIFHNGKIVSVVRGEN
ncbi:MAG: exodeoxyribonuclease VII large subunit [Paludibacteraceae bacterium]|nr:exodeoxyribonuclease VII large subunit [Paludibacteraceae bacterium]